MRVLHSASPPLPHLDNILALQETLQSSLSDQGRVCLDIKYEDLTAQPADLEQAQLSLRPEVDSLPVQTHWLAGTEDVLDYLETLPGADHHPATSLLQAWSCWRLVESPQ